MTREEIVAEARKVHSEIVASDEGEAPLMAMFRELFETVEADGKRLDAIVRKIKGFVISETVTRGRLQNANNLRDLAGTFQEYFDELSASPCP